MSPRHYLLCLRMTKRQSLPNLALTRQPQRERHRYQMAKEQRMTCILFLLSSLARQQDLL